MILKVSTMINC